MWYRPQYSLHRKRALHKGDESLKFGCWKGDLHCCPRLYTSPIETGRKEQARLGPCKQGMILVYEVRVHLGAASLECNSAYSLLEAGQACGAAGPQFWTLLVWHSRRLWLTRGSGRVLCPLNCGTEMPSLQQMVPLPSTPSGRLPSHLLGSSAHCFPAQLSRRLSLTP